MCRRYMHALMTASCTAVSTRVWINARYALRVGTRSDKMTLVMLREMTSPRGRGFLLRLCGMLHIIPRLKRLFRNKEHARLLRWHKEDCKKDGKLRHPADGSQWRKIERGHSEFTD